MARRNGICPPDCEHCERIAEDRANGNDMSPSDLDYGADMAADRYERWLDKIGE